MPDKDYQLKVLISREEIKNTVAKLANEIEEDYRGKHPLLICVLKGSFVFMADLIRQLDLPSSGKVKVVQRPKTPVKGRDVLVIEDIVDTGLTLSFLLNYLRRKKPASLKVCALTDKPSRRKAPVSIEYLGFTLPNKFVVGYGLDLNQKFRNLPDICAFEDNESS